MPIFILDSNKMQIISFDGLPKSGKLKLFFESNEFIDVIFVPNSINPVERINAIRLGEEPKTKYYQHKMNFGAFLEMEILPQWAGETGWKLIFGNPNPKPVPVFYQMLSTEPDDNLTGIFD